MPNISASGSPASSTSVTISGKSAFFTSTQTVGTSETTIVIPADAVQFRIKAGNKAVLTYSNVTTGTGSIATSDTIPKLNSWEESNLSLSGALTIYIKSDIMSTDVHLTYWT